MLGSSAQWCRAGEERSGCGGRRASPRRSSGGDQPSASTGVRAPETNLLPTPADPGAPQDPGVLADLAALCCCGRPSRSPCQSGSAELPGASCLHPPDRRFQQIFSDLQSVVAAWPAPVSVSGGLVPLRSLSCKWSDGKSLASSNSHLDIAGTGDNEGL